METLTTINTKQYFYEYILKHPLVNIMNEGRFAIYIPYTHKGTIDKITLNGKEMWKGIINIHDHHNNATTVFQTFQILAENENTETYTPNPLEKQTSNIDTKYIKILAEKETKNKSKKGENMNLVFIRADYVSTKPTLDNVIVNHCNVLQKYAHSNNYQKHVIEIYERYIQWHANREMNITEIKDINPEFIPIEDILVYLFVYVLYNDTTNTTYDIKKVSGKAVSVYKLLNAYFTKDKQSVLTNTNNIINNTVRTALEQLHNNPSEVENTRKKLNIVFPLFINKLNQIKKPPNSQQSSSGTKRIRRYTEYIEPSTPKNTPR